MRNVVSRPLHMIRVTATEQRTLQIFATVDSKIKWTTTVRKHLKDISKEYQLIMLKPH